MHLGQAAGDADGRGTAGEDGVEHDGPLTAGEREREHPVIDERAVDDCRSPAATQGDAGAVAGGDAVFDAKPGGILGEDAREAVMDLDPRKRHLRSTPHEHARLPGATDGKITDRDVVPLDHDRVTCGGGVEHGLARACPDERDARGNDDTLDRMGALRHANLLPPAGRLHRRGEVERGGRPRRHQADDGERWCDASHGGGPERNRVKPWHGVLVWLGVGGTACI